MANVMMAGLLRRFGSRAALYSLAAIPLAPCAYVLMTRGGECFGRTRPGSSVIGCLGWFVVRAPFVATEGDIFPGDQPFWMHRVEALATALVIGCLIAVIAMHLRRGQGESASPGGAPPATEDGDPKAIAGVSARKRGFAPRFVIAPVLLTVELCFLLLSCSAFSGDGAPASHDLNLLLASSLILGQFFGLCDAAAELVLPRQCAAWIRLLAGGAAASVTLAFVSGVVIGRGVMPFVLALPLWLVLFGINAGNLRLATIFGRPRAVKVAADAQLRVGTSPPIRGG